MIILKVPYAEKDEAKALGARWSSERKVWYVPEGKSADTFKRWAPSEVAGATAGPAAPKAGQVNTLSAKPVTGAAYVDLAHDCNPFAQCPQCGPLLEQAGWAKTRDQVRKMLATRP